MEIALRDGETALIDPEDYDRVRAYRWRVRASGGKYGKPYVVAAYLDRAAKKTAWVRLHRVILDAPPGAQVDHINGDTLDNRRSNLRLCSNAQNQQNSGSRCGTSRFKGVAWFARYGRWRVAFRWQGRDYFVGYFEHEESAARAYDAAIRPLAGEFARLNFPPSEAALDGPPNPATITVSVPCQGAESGCGQ